MPPWNPQSMTKEQCDFGLIGLAVMGENLALNIESRGYRVAVFNRTTSKVDEFIAGRAKGKKFVGCHSLEELVQSLETPRKVMMMVKAGPAGRRADRAAAAAASTRATSSSTAATRTTPTPSGARKYVEAKGLLLHRHRRFRRRRRAPQGPEHHARRQRRGLAARQADLSSHRRQGRPEQRHPLLRMGRPARRRALREDGPQRHRVRRHAAHLRSLSPAEGRRWACRTTSCTTCSTEWNRGELESYLIEITRDIFSVKDPRRRRLPGR